MMCEKCWSKAYRASYCEPMKSQPDFYNEFIKDCKHTPEQQAGTESNVQTPEGK